MFLGVSDFFMENTTMSVLSKLQLKNLTYTLQHLMRIKHLKNDEYYTLSELSTRFGKKSKLDQTASFLTHLISEKKAQAFYRLTFKDGTVLYVNKKSDEDENPVKMEWVIKFTL